MGRLAARLSIACAVVGGGACGQHPPTAPPSPPPGAPIRIVATERGPDGGALVVIGESGDRLGGLVAAPGGAEPIRDTSAAFSPDGRWVAFASSRGRAIDQSSLWVAPVGYDATPVRLTGTAALDTTPVWTPDGRAIVFASSRGGSFDLWRLSVAVADGTLAAAGEPVQLTRAAGQELSPTIAPDGRIAYTAVVVDADGGTRSSIEVLAPDGTIATVEPGPADAAPRFDPSGARLAFTRPTVREGDGDGDAAFAAVDSDLWIDDGAGAHRVIDLPFTDESGPVFSHDGRWLLATSLVRKPSGQALFSSVIVVDLAAAPPVARMLVDRAGAVTRLSPAVAPVALDAGELVKSPVYVDELRRTLRDAIERNEARDVSTRPE